MDLLSRKSCCWAWATGLNRMSMVRSPGINNDPLTPNEAYFKHVDAVVQIARENNLVISMTIFHQRWRNFITLEKARAWAKWIAQPL